MIPAGSIAPRLLAATLPLAVASSALLTDRPKDLARTPSGPATGTEAQVEAQMGIDQTFAAVNVRFSNGVLVVESLGMSMPVPAGWLLRMPDGDSAVLDNLELGAQIQLSAAAWKADSQPGLLRAYVQAALASAGNVVEKGGPVTIAGLRGEEAFAVSRRASGPPRQQIHLHMVGLVHDRHLYFFVVKAPVASFDKPDLQFLSALSGLKFSTPRAASPAAGQGRKP